MPHLNEDQHPVGTKLTIKDNSHFGEGREADVTVVDWFYAGGAQVVTVAYEKPDYATRMTADCHKFEVI